MRPNARTIKKVLMKGRNVVFWGSRAFLTVRFPASVAPPRPNPPPVPQGTGWRELFGGHWIRELPVGDIPLEEREREGFVRDDESPAEDTDILWESWNIAKLYCGDDPRKDYEEGVDHHIEDRHVIFDRPPREITRKDEDGNEVTETWQPCTFWEGVLHHNIRRADEEFDREKNESYVLEPDVIDAFIAQDEWRDKYMMGMHQLDEGDEPRSEILEEFLEAGWYAKTHYYHMSDDERYIYFTYSVKWFYPRRKFGFCNALARAFRVAHDAGVDVKLMR